MHALTFTNIHGRQHCVTTQYDYTYRGFRIPFNITIVSETFVRNTFVPRHLFRIQTISIPYIFRACSHFVEIQQYNMCII